MPEPDLVERLLAECLEAPEEERARALEERCRAHPEVADALRDRFQALARFGLLQDPTPDPPAPERLGEFRLLETLGGGGMGVVHLAEQEPLGRRVALKCIRPEHLYFEGARERFRREVAAVARLKHPNIVPIYTFGEEDGVPYFAMERIEGRSLADVLALLQGRPPHERTGADVARALDADAAAFEGTWAEIAIRIARQVAAALAHAHARGVVHRDVKPSNVMLTPEGRALLFDFGVAGGFGAVDRLTRSGTMVGSLPYLAPEAAAGRSGDADPRLDVYALGVTLYEMLTLRLPFRADTTDALLRRIVEGAP
ncbi:MAG: serine/threonine-protein kinase, partial [Planctomycetota bacterium JB042]